MRWGGADALVGVGFYLVFGFPGGWVQYIFSRPDRLEMNKRIEKNCFLTSSHTHTHNPLPALKHSVNKCLVLVNQQANDGKTLQQQEQ